MKTFTHTSSSVVIRIVVACLFSTGIAFCDSLGSSIHYRGELETKQSSLNTIQEDVSSVEEALEKKLEELRQKKKRKGQTRLDTLDFVGHDIAALLPSAPRPGFTMRAAPTGTLTPQGSSEVVDRGFTKERLEGK